MIEADILKICDHTILRPDAGFDEIAENCRLAIKYSCASFCLAPAFVYDAKHTFGDRLKICTVVGFPNGYNDTASKVYEIERMIEEGADEIDAVINIGAACSESYSEIARELSALRSAAKEKTLKIIVETCYLKESVLKNICHLVSASGADYIKTSTGFGKYGARVKDVMLMREECSPQTKIKASGGISNFKEAKDLIMAGADRLGTSRLVWITENK